MDYKVLRSDELVEGEESEIWSLAHSTDSSLNGSGSDESLDQTIFDHGQQPHQPIAKVAGENENLNGSYSESKATPIHGPAYLRPESGSAVDEQLVIELDAGDCSFANTSKESAGKQTLAQRHSHTASTAIPEAKPVGDAAEDQSLALKSTRSHLFSEKFRDSLVDRILAGKVTISSLTESGEYSEAELVSWIADKVKRQDEKIETLEFDLYSYWKQSRDRDGVRPNAAR